MTKYWPTKKIKEVLEENYCRGISGKDFEELKEELQTTLWERQNKTEEEELERLLEEQELMEVAC